MRDGVILKLIFLLIARLFHFHLILLLLFAHSKIDFYLMPRFNIFRQSFKPVEQRIEFVRIVLFVKKKMSKKHFFQIPKQSNDF